jgi:AcrR family transcriptional regulator
MPRDATPRTRSYTSALRTEQARLTRQRIIDAARELFVARGYARTTVADIARAADGSPETVYALFDGKYGLLRA